MVAVGTYPLFCLYTSLVCVKKVPQRHHLKDQLDWDKITAEAEMTQICWTNLKGNSVLSQSAQSCSENCINAIIKVDLMVITR